MGPIDHGLSGRQHGLLQKSHLNRLTGVTSDGPVIVFEDARSIAGSTGTDCEQTEIMIVCPFIGIDVRFLLNLSSASHRG